MRTAEEMYDYTLKNKYGTGTIKSSTRKHFEVLENQLQNDEHAIITFVGLHEQKDTDLQGNFAYAITNKRLIMSQKGAFGRDKTKTILLENLNDVTVKNGLVWRTIEIDTIKDHFSIKNNTNVNKDLGNQVQEVIFSLKKHNGDVVHEPQRTNSIEGIREYKQLMDDGIISEEEFEQKKKELLGL